MQRMSKSILTMTFIKPDWPAPENIKACSTTREAGVSEKSYASFNLAGHVEDKSLYVKKNRQILFETS